MLLIPTAIYLPNRLKMLDLNLPVSESYVCLYKNLTDVC